MVRFTFWGNHFDLNRVMDLRRARQRQGDGLRNHYNRRCLGSSLETGIMCHKRKSELRKSSVALKIRSIQKNLFDK